MFIVGQTIQGTEYLQLSTPIHMVTTFCTHAMYGTLVQVLVHLGHQGTQLFQKSGNS